MFGRDKGREKGPDLDKLQSAVSDARVSGVRNLSVRQSGRQFEIHGEADSLNAKQQAFKTITDRVGDAAGVVNLIQVAQEPTSPSLGRGGPQAAPRAGTVPLGGAGRTHKVQRGETLSHLAQQYYGKASEYNKIFEANRDQLNDPDKIREGMTLRIP